MHMEKERLHQPTWKEKIRNTTLAFSLSFSLHVPSTLSQDVLCKEALAHSHIEREEAPLLGFTFNPNEARYVGLDPKYAMEELLKMGFDQVRIAMYANLPTEQILEEIGWQLDLAEQYNTDVILGIGPKAPGWPERYSNDHEDTLAKAQALLEAQGNHPNIRIIQVSNEPTLKTFDLPPDDPQVITSLVELISSYGKPMLLTHFADPTTLRMFQFNEALSYGSDTIGIDVYLETGTGRGSCYTYSKQLQSLNEIAKRENKPLQVTELQTLPWPDQISIPVPMSHALLLPLPFQRNLEPAEIRKLYKMVLLNTDAESIHFWEMTKLLGLKEQGDPTRINEVGRILDQNHRTRKQLLYQREEQNGGIISFSHDHSRFDRIYDDD